MKKLLLALCSSLLLPGCAQLPPEPATDWIDVPLTDHTWWEAETPWYEAEYRIPVAAGAALEHKITMDEGDMVVYQWTVAMSDASQLTAEFHGHTERVGDAPGTVMFYKIHQDGKEAGTLKAPFSGIHGWYFNNQSTEDIEVVLKVAGFFRD